MELTRAELADKLGLTVSTIRKWEGLFRPFLEARPGTRGVGSKQTYAAADVEVFTAVATLRRQGFTLEEVQTRLSEYLDTAAPPLLTELEPATAAAPVALSAYLDLARALEAAESSAAAITEERDYLRRRLEGLELQLMEEARRAAAAEARAELMAGRPPGFWSRLMGGRRPD